MSSNKPRTYIFGNIFWVSRIGWKGIPGFGTNMNKSHHPGLVIQSLRHSYQPVMMAPGSTKIYEWLSPPELDQIFSPALPIYKANGLGTIEKEGYYSLYHTIPVKQKEISGKVGKLQSSDQHRLTGMLTEISWSSEDA